MFEFIEILVVIFCGAIFAANLIDAFRYRRPPTFKKSAVLPGAGQQKP